MFVMLMHNYKIMNDINNTDFIQTSVSQEKVFLDPKDAKNTKDNLSNLNWLPKSCAYRLLSEGKDLLWWHPLVSGDPNTVHSAGISIKKRCVVETEVIDIENHIVTWPNED